MFSFSMFTFSMVKRIGEGSYLNDDVFILERARKERALNMHCMKADEKRLGCKAVGENGRSKSS